MRLIDADAYVKATCDICWSKDVCADGYCEVTEMLETFSTVDAVPVVRCKDCKYYHLFDEGFRDCRHSRGLYDAYQDDFCSYGERREDG